MKSALLTVSLLLLLLQEGQTNVKCWNCTSLPDNQLVSRLEDQDCVKGTGNIASVTCPLETDGCYASVTVEDETNSTEWRRGCCGEGGGEKPPCENKHEHLVDSTIYLVSCQT